jgi:hypothetical protein
MTALNAIDKNAGKYGFQFLKIPSSPAIAAMGNTGEILHNSPLNIMHHPAAFDWQRGKSVTFSQTSWLVDTNIYNIAYRNIMFDKGFGLGIKYVDHGSFERRTDNGTLIGEYFPLDIKFTANYTQKLTPDIHAGINLSLLYEKIDTSSALGFTTDLGLVYLTPIRNTSVDIALQNIGTSTKMDLEKIELPFICEFGTTTGIDVNNDISAFFAGKLVYMSDHDNLLPAIGLNLKLYDMFFVRAGYKFNYNDEDFSAGFGINYRNFTIDYSFVHINNDLNSVHLFGLGLNF